MDIKTGLDLLRSPFEKRHINKLPKGTKVQNQCSANEKKSCAVCGGWHHPKIIHLDYVGHAALTDRLLDADPLWSWEPMAYKDGLPAFDASGGLWIKLTVCEHTRIGYGHAESSNYKEIGSREKEVIGDALRNAAMRFGAALDLWHKGDLHGPAEPDTNPDPDSESHAVKPKNNKVASTDNTGISTKEQNGKIFDAGKTAKLSPEDIIKVVNFFKAGDNLTPTEADELLKNFPAVVANYKEVINSESDIPT